MIRLENISILNNTNKEVLKDINLFLPSGSVISINSSRSCGKTRLMQTIGLIERPKSGNLYLLGKNIKRLNKSELSEIHREIGIVFEENNFIKNFNIESNIIFPLILKKERLKDIEQALKELLPWLNLETVVKKYTWQLSNAELKLAQFARAIIGRPRILLLDNFFMHIEKSMYKKINYLLLALNKIGTTIIIFGDIPKDNSFKFNKIYFISNKQLLEING